MTAFDFGNIVYAANIRVGELPCNSNLGEEALPGAGSSASYKQKKLQGNGLA